MANTSAKLKDQVRVRVNSSQEVLVRASDVSWSYWEWQVLSVFFLYFCFLNQMGHQSRKNGVKLFDLTACLWAFNLVVSCCPFLVSVATSAVLADGFPFCVLLYTWWLFSSPEIAAFLCCHVDVVYEVL